MGHLIHKHLVLPLPLQKDIAQGSNTSDDPGHEKGGSIPWPHRSSSTIFSAKLAIKRNHHKSPKAPKTLNRSHCGGFGQCPLFYHKQLYPYSMPTKCLEGENRTRGPCQSKKIKVSESSPKAHNEFFGWGPLVPLYHSNKT